MSPERVVVCGAVAQKPGQAGHTWQFLQYLLGLRLLGHDVLFLDELPQDPGAESPEVEYLTRAMAAHGLEGAWSLRAGPVTYGVDRGTVLDHVRTSVALINVMGYLADEGVLAAAPIRVFLDTDPGFGQMWCELGTADVFRGHDRFVTIGERIGQADCGLPACGLEWHTTKQPVVLDEWPAVPLASDGPVTSIGAWRGPYDPVELGGRRYGLRAHEFRRFADLPRRCPGVFELALDIDPADHADLALLREGGWRMVDPRLVARDTSTYRDYLRASSAELMIAKEIYVATRSGWFSERSICYLASGRPVIAQDTGLAGLLPLGDGLLVFATPVEAVAALEEVRGRPRHHASAAREVAEAHFDARIVLPRLLDTVTAAPVPA